MSVPLLEGDGSAVGRSAKKTKQRQDGGEADGGIMSRDPGENSC